MLARSAATSLDLVKRDRHCQLLENAVVSAAAGAARVCPDKHPVVRNKKRMHLESKTWPRLFLFKLSKTQQCRKESRRQPIFNSKATRETEFSHSSAEPLPVGTVGEGLRGELNQGVG